MLSHCFKGIVTFASEVQELWCAVVDGVAMKAGIRINDEIFKVWHCISSIHWWCMLGDNLCCPFLMAVCLNGWLSCDHHLFGCVCVSVCVSVWCIQQATSAALEWAQCEPTNKSQCIPCCSTVISVVRLWDMDNLPTSCSNAGSIPHEVPSQDRSH